MAIRVLVVDDDGAARAAMKALLSAKGYEVDQAVDGQAALERVTELPPDVVVTDLDMPRMNGLALLKELHVRTPDLPAIVVTSGATSLTRKEMSRIWFINGVVAVMPVRHQRPWPCRSTQRRGPWTSPSRRAAC